MAYSTKPTDDIALLGTSNPAVINNAAASSPWVPFNRAQKGLFAVIVGNIDTTLTGIKLQAATDAAGTGAIDIPGKTAAALSATDDNKQVLINLDAGELADLGIGYTHARVTATVGNGATGAAITLAVFGVDTRWKPASQYNATSVAQVAG